jgi:hypothetical protein
LRKSWGKEGKKKRGGYLQSRVSIILLFVLALSSVNQIKSWYDFWDRVASRRFCFACWSGWCLPCGQNFFLG